jgi:hypothetical protein
MIRERKHKVFGTPMSEWVDSMPQSMEDIGVDLGGIVSAGTQGYGLEGPELLDFIRKCLYALLRAGAMPLKLEPIGKNGFWFPETRYGTDHGAIVEGVIADWLKEGEMYPAWEKFRFGDRKVLEAQGRYDDKPVRW